MSHGNSYTIDDVYILGVVRLRVAGYHPVDSPPLSPGADGVVEITYGTASKVILAAGSTVKGFRFVDEFGATLISDQWDDDDAVEVMVSVEEGGTVTVIHDDPGVTEPTERCYSPIGAIVAGDPAGLLTYNQAWMVNRYVASQGARRWVMPWLM